MSSLGQFSEIFCSGCALKLILLIEYVSFTQYCPYLAKNLANQKPIFLKKSLLIVFMLVFLFCRFSFFYFFNVRTKNHVIRALSLSQIFSLKPLYPTLVGKNSQIYDVQVTGKYI